MILTFKLKPLPMLLLVKAFSIMKVSEFISVANRLNYNVVIGDNYNIDNLNKTITIKNTDNKFTLWKILLSIAFYLTPVCVKNFFIDAYCYQYHEKPDDTKLYYEIVDRFKANNVDYNYIKNKYVSMFTTFHSHVNRSFIKEFTNASFIFVSKLLDSSDEYFNTDYTAHKINKYDVRKVVNDNKQLINIIDSYGGVIGGSLALSHYGTVYRDNFHDVDFILPISSLDRKLVKLINNASKISVINKDKRNKEKIVPELFIKTKLYKALSKISNNIKIKDFNIDQLNEYDKIAKGIIILTINGKDYDLIFRDFVNAISFTYNGYTYKCQAMQDGITMKHLMNRAKDFQDLINFKPELMILNN